MKQTVNFSAFCDAFHAYNRYDQFGYDALKVLFDYLEELEEDTGNEMELDVIALCCDYSVDSWQDIASNTRLTLTTAKTTTNAYRLFWSTWKTIQASAALWSMVMVP